LDPHPSSVKDLLRGCRSGHPEMTASAAIAETDENLIVFVFAIDFDRRSFIINL
jgi:hypothetical protein